MGILQLRKLYFQNKATKALQDRNYKPMWKELKTLAKILNDRRISIGGHITKFKPHTINKKNLNSYLKTLKTYNKAFEFSNYVVDSTGYNFGKLELGHWYM